MGLYIQGLTRVLSGKGATLARKFNALCKSSVVEGSDASLSWPFDTLIGAFCLTFRALSDAPISVANGRDLGPLRASSKVHGNYAQEQAKRPFPIDNTLVKPMR